MIKVRVIQTSEGDYRGFELKGHADYADEGSDIICSAVSMLVINTINSIETFTDDKFDAFDDSGFVRFEFKDICSKESKLLVDSMVLGLKQVQVDYGKQYIKILYEEV